MSWRVPLGLSLLSFMIVATAHAEEPTTDSSQNAWIFNPLSVMRDPFVPPSSQKREVFDELKQFDLNEINLVAILTGIGAPQAMVVLPNGKTHIIQVNDALGRHKGRVHKITSNEVIIQEAFKDFKGRDKKSFTSLVLAQ